MARIRGALVAAVVAVAAVVVASGGTTAASSYLDPTYGVGGVAQFTPPNVAGTLTLGVADVATMPDGRVVMAGGANGAPCAQGAWWVGRYNEDGSLDTTFGNGTGYVLVTPSSLSGCTAGPFAPLLLRAVAVQSTGKIVLGGGPNLVLMRLNADGTVDNAFAPTRRTLPNANNINTACLNDFDRTGGRVWDLLVGADDRLYAAGSLARMTQAPTQACPSGRFAQGPAVVRLEADGTGQTELAAPWGTATAERAAERITMLSDGTPVAVTDTALHWLGAAQTTAAGAAPGSSTPIGLVADSQDRVVLGTTTGNLGVQLSVRRYEAAGSLDPAFAAGGVFTDDTLGRYRTLTVDADDRIALLGSRDTQIDDLTLARLDGSGALDATFGSGGIVHHRPARNVLPGNFGFRGLRALPDGSLRTLATSQDAIVFGRLAADGSADATFAGDGFAFTTSPVTRVSEQQNSLADAAVLPSGATLVLQGADIVRWSADGTIDAVFGDAGRLRAPAGTRFNRLLIDPAGRLVAAGTNGSDGTNDESSFLGRFDATTGVPDPTFGGDGFVALTDQHVTSIAADASGRLLVGLQHNENGLDRGLVRLQSDGSADATFGTDGRAAIDFAYHLVTVDATGRLVVAGIVPFAGTSLLRRLTPDGAPDPTFSETTLAQFPLRLLLDPTGRILPIIGGTTFATRVLPDGGIDATFADGGSLPYPEGAHQTTAVLDELGRLVLVSAMMPDDVMVRRYTVDGVPDTTFASGGSARLRLPLPSDRDISTPTGSRVGAGYDAAGRLVVGVHAGLAGQTQVGQVLSMLRFRAEPPADTSPPVATITAPVDGATYLIYNGLFADFACADAESGLVTCTGDRNDGQQIDLAPGDHTFAVSVSDFAGNVATTMAHYSVLDAVVTSLPAGTSTGTGFGDATPTDPIETRVTTPNAGDLTILEHPLSATPAGYRMIGWESVITAPPASAAQPLQLTFWLDASVLDGLDATTVVVLRDGTPVAECADPPSATAAPDPCIVGRVQLPSGDVQIDVLTSAASTWTFGTPSDSTPPTIDVVRPADGAAYTMGQAVTASYSCADAGSGLATCAGPVADGASLDTSTPGTFPFVVTATDVAGNEHQIAGTYQVLAGSVTATVTGPAAVTTDPGGLGSSPVIPVQTRLDVPVGASGQYRLTARPAGAAPAGHVLFGTAVETAGAAAPNAADPHVLTFDVDASLVGAVPAAQVQVFRGATPVPACSGPGAAPDPCVAGRAATPSGDVTVAVRTSQLGTWSFGRRSFIVVGATPASRAQGTSAQTITINGDGFAPTATAKFSGAGVSVTAITRTPTALQLTVTVGGSAAVGPRDVIVTNPGSVVATCAGCFTVNAKPTVTSVTPASRPQGVAHAALQVNGSGFQGGAAVSFEGTGITVHSVTFVDASRLDLDVSIDAAAATGVRTITVVNPDGGAVTKGGTFAVNAVPVVTGTAPTLVRRGQTVAVAVLGSGFPATFVAGGGTVDLGPGLTVQSVVRSSASKLTVTTAIDPGADPGPRTVGVVNPDGGATTCAGCLTVVADPAITAVDPPSRARGAANQTVTITGSGFQPGAIVKFVGGGVTLQSTTVVDAATIAVQLSVGGQATLGSRDVTVTNPDSGSATCAGCFGVNARPTITALTPSTGARGATGLAVQVTGTGLQPGMVVTVSGDGVTATVVDVTPTAATLSVSIATAAPTGQRSVTVTNPDTGAVTKSNALRIT